MLVQMLGQPPAILGGQHRQGFREAMTKVLSPKGKLAPASTNLASSPSMEKNARSTTGLIAAACLANCRGFPVSLQRDAR